MDYWKKEAEKLHCAENLEWNFPEQKQGRLGIFGGHSGGFATEVKIAGVVSEKFKFLGEVKNFFPESLKKNFPVMANLEFLPATESGSLKKSAELLEAVKGVDFSLFLGDFSKNSETAIAASEAISECPGGVVVTRDTVDLVSSEMENLIMNEKLTIVGSLAQVQKVFKAVYYPRMILLSQPLSQVIETLHKFTLSYPLSLMTFHEGFVLVARNGKVYSVALSKTKYSPLTLWSGEVAAKASVYLMFNGTHPVESLLAGLE